MRFLSMHGRRVGFDADTDGIIFEGIRGQSLLFKKQITSAQLLALNAVPQVIVPALGAGVVTALKRIAIYKPAGTAYAGIAAGEDLVAKYTNAAGAQVSSVIETTGFLDQATAQQRYSGDQGAVTTAAADVASVANAALVLHLLVGEITTGTSDLFVWTWVDYWPLVLDATALG